MSRITYYKSNETVSLKLGVVIVPTSQMNMLTVGRDPVGFGITFLLLSPLQNTAF